jgi:hypothetical protein
MTQIELFYADFLFHAKAQRSQGRKDFKAKGTQVTQIF